MKPVITKNQVRQAVRVENKGGTLDAAQEAKATLESILAPVQSIIAAQGNMFVGDQTKELADDNRDNASDGQSSKDESAGTERSREAGNLHSGSSGKRGSGDRGAERAEGRSEPGADGARDSDGERAGTSLERSRARNHVIQAGGLEPARGEKTRARESIAAIRVLRELEYPKGSNELGGRIANPVMILG